MCRSHLSHHTTVICVCVLFLLVAALPVFGLTEGDSCSISQTGSTGVCRLITNCPAVVASLQQRKPTLCGYSGFYQVVCCPLQVIRSTAPPPVASSRISARKCTEYQSAVTELRRYNTVNGVVEKNESVCNLDATKYIVDGEETTPYEFPHMVLFGYASRDEIMWLCGGSLISEQYVLTAGHCIRTNFGPPTVARLGVHSVSGMDLEDRTQTISVADVVPHPDYRRSVSNYNDIGLVRLQDSATFTPYVRPACLPAGSSDFFGLRSAVASGWGHTEFNGSPSDKLMKVRLDLYSAVECNETYTRKRNSKLKQGVNAETQMCAGSRTEQKDSCRGDSGGPLQIQHVSEYCMYSVQGVVSFGLGCGVVNTPSVYTRVLGFLPWIESVVWPHC